MPVLKFFGHAAFKFSSPKTNVLFDPGYLDGKPLVSTAEKVNVICVTHSHPDHLGNAARIAEAQKAFIVGLSDVIEKLRADGAPEWLLRSLNPGESFIRPEVKVTAIGVHHGPPKSPIPISHTAFLVELGKVKLVHLGDAGTRGLLGQYQIDVLLISVDETEAFPPIQALQAVSDLKPQMVIPMHVRKKEELDYFEEHLPLMAPDVKYKRMESGEEIVVEWVAGTEFTFKPVTSTE